MFNGCEYSKTIPDCQLSPAISSRMKLRRQKFLRVPLSDRHDDALRIDARRVGQDTGIIEKDIRKSVQLPEGVDGAAAFVFSHRAGTEKMYRGNIHPFFR